MKKKLLTILLLFIFLTSSIKNIRGASTANGSVSTSVSSSSVVLGNQIVLNINLSCDTGVGGAKLIISYDSSYLTLSNYDLHGKGTFSNNVILVEPSESTSINYTLTFTAIKIGNTGITVNTSQFIDYTDGSYISNYADSITKSVEVIAKTNNNPGTTTVPAVTLSSDATLYSLKISNINLEEAFESDKYTYTAYTEDKITQLDIQAVCSSSKATYTVEGNSLNEGWNEVTIVCTAEDGKVKEYKINVYVEETPSVFYQDNKYGVVKNLDKISPPEDFIKKEEVIENNNLIIFEHGNLNLIYLVDENNRKDFYVLDKTNNRIICKYQPIVLDNKKYVIIDFSYDNFKQLEENFEPSKYRFEESIILNCWKYKAENMSNYRLFYLMDENGESNLYSYETTERTMQKYTDPLNIEKTDNSQQIKEMIYIGCGVAGVFCLIISLAITNKKSK
ncbi:MAG: cadherin-like beta sandwich domain-containing protein [Erysipelotrichia bacterium]|nr:cadherin-like beta sandwich domain-containing protein [Erysipelotrichia bacterium]